MSCTTPHKDSRAWTLDQLQEEDEEEAPEFLADYELEESDGEDIEVSLVCSEGMLSSLFTVCIVMCVYI